MSVIYRGKRTDDGVKVDVVRNEKSRQTVKPLRHVNYYSVDGFEWGYGGSGPADLALSILAHHLGETWVNGPYLRKMKITQEAPLCWKFHQDFKRDIIAGLDRDSWEITQEQVHNWLMAQSETIDPQDIDRPDDLELALDYETEQRNEFDALSE